MKHHITVPDHFGGHGFVERMNRVLVDSVSTPLNVGIDILWEKIMRRAVGQWSLRSLLDHWSSVPNDVRERLSNSPVSFCPPIGRTPASSPCSAKRTSSRTDLAKTLSDGLLVDEAVNDVLEGRRDILCVEGLSVSKRVARELTAVHTIGGETRECPRLASRHLRQWALRADGRTLSNSVSSQRSPGLGLRSAAHFRKYGS